MVDHKKLKIQREIQRKYRVDSQNGVLEVIYSIPKIMNNLPVMNQAPTILENRNNSVIHSIAQLFILIHDSIKSWLLNMHSV